MTTLKIFFLAALFIATSGAIYKDYFRRHKELSFLASIVALVGAFYLFKDIYRDFIKPEPDEIGQPRIAPQFANTTTQKEQQPATPSTAGTYLTAAHSDKKDHSSDSSSVPSDTISIENDCSREINVATHYLSRNGSWITTGWWTIHPQDTVTINIEPIGTKIYFFGEDSNGGKWSGEDAAISVDRAVFSDSFTYSDNSELPPQNKRIVSFFGADVGDEYSDFTQNFSCN